MKVDTLLPCGVDVSDFPSLEVRRGVLPFLPTEGATESHAVLVGLRLCFPTGRCGLAESRKGYGD